MTDIIPLGTGTLTWNAAERRSDRYGTVFLMAPGDNSTTDTATNQIDGEAFDALSGRKGILVAEITGTREITHIGDFARSLTPTTPEVGEQITLGEGAFFYEDDAVSGLMVGVRPDDERDSDWLSPQALYRCHEQDVILVFFPADRTH